MSLLRTIDGLRAPATDPVEFARLGGSCEAPRRACFDAWNVPQHWGGVHRVSCLPTGVRTGVRTSFSREGKPVGMLTQGKATRAPRSPLRMLFRRAVLPSKCQRLPRRASGRGEKPVREDMRLLRAYHSGIFPRSRDPHGTHNAGFTIAKTCSLCHGFGMARISGASC